MLLETEEYKGLTIELHSDDDCSFDFAFGDEPIVILSAYRGGVDAILDQSKTIELDRTLARNMLIAIRDSDIEELANELDLELRKTAKSWVIDNYNYFKSEKAAFNFLVRSVFGCEVSIDSYDTNDSTFFLVWNQKELDKYAGVKNAKPAIETLRHVVDGEVYGYVIRETDESCWGFVGEAEYCMSEARNAANWIAEKRDETAARELEQSRSDMYERTN